jgi:hypothetical protein
VSAVALLIHLKRVLGEGRTYLKGLIRLTRVRFPKVFSLRQAKKELVFISSLVMRIPLKIAATEHPSSQLSSNLKCQTTTTEEDQPSTI